MWRILIFLLFRWQIINKSFLIWCGFFFFILKIFILQFYHPWFFVRWVEKFIVIKYFNLFFILLRVFIIYLIVLCIRRRKYYELWFLCSIILNIIFFSTGKVILFYVFFELRIIPILIIILKWGLKPERLKASMYLIIYTLVGSVPLIIGLVYFIGHHYKIKEVFHFGLRGAGLLGGHTAELLVLSFGKDYLYLYWCLITYINRGMWIVGFFIKLPLFGLHLWLPKAHVESPTEGSMLLARVLLKLGVFGFIRLSHILDHYKDIWVSVFSRWGIWSILVVRLLCFRNIDLKIMIAYSSVFHMLIIVFIYKNGHCLKILALVFISVGHGFCSSVLFWNVGKFYINSSTRKLNVRFGYIWQFPIFLFIWLFCLVLNSKFPPFIKFFSEIFIFFISMEKLTCIGLLIIWSVFIGGLFKIYIYMVKRHGKYSLSLQIFKTIDLKKIFLSLIHLFLNIIAIYWIALF